jgi:small-conductance mechanosensitive channel/CRP-like cAMP-binding protein
LKDTNSLAAVRPLRLSALLWPLLLLALGLGLQFGLSSRASWAALASGASALQAIETFSWLVGVWLLIRLADVLLWERWVPRWLGVRAPALLRQFVAVMLVVLTLAVVMSRTWGLAVPAVLATTGVLGIVLGLALRNILADFFSGIALNIEKPFDLGDFIMLRVRGQRDPFAGTVREINWRSTRLLTPEDNLVSVPNSLVAGAIVENLSYPSPVSELELDLTLDWDVPQARAERLLVAAATEAWAMGATAGNKPPKLRMCRIDGGGITWRFVYLLDPRLRGKGPARHTLLACVHRHLRLVGLRPAALPNTAVPTPAHGPAMRSHDNPNDRQLVLAEAALLASLSTAERLQLADGVVVQALAERQAVVTAGDAGDTLFVVVEGALEVHIGPADAPQRVNVLGPGSVFGEMAVFTGEPRSATVTTLCPCVLYAIGREQLLPLLGQRPSLVDELSLAVAQYQARDKRTLAQGVADTATAVPSASLVRQLATRLRGWVAGAPLRKGA